MVYWCVFQLKSKKPWERSVIMSYLREHNNPPKKCRRPTKFGRAKVNFVDFLVGPKSIL